MTLFFTKYLSNGAEQLSRYLNVKCLAENLLGLDKYLVLCQWSVPVSTGQSRLLVCDTTYYTSIYKYGQLFSSSPVVQSVPSICRAFGISTVISHPSKSTHSTTIWIPLSSTLRKSLSSTFFSLVFILGSFRQLHNDRLLFPHLRF